MYVQQSSELCIHNAQNSAMSGYACSGYQTYWFHSVDFGEMLHFENTFFTDSVVLSSENFLRNHPERGDVIRQLWPTMMQNKNLSPSSPWVCSCCNCYCRNPKSRKPICYVIITIHGLKTSSAETIRHSRFRGFHLLHNSVFSILL